jgi:hypothetical protein
MCPNCHAVIHRREPPFSIEEVREMPHNDGVHELSGTERNAHTKG